MKGWGQRQRVRCVWTAAEGLYVWAFQVSQPIRLTHTFLVRFCFWCVPCSSTPRCLPDTSGHEYCIYFNPKHWHYLWGQSSSAVKRALSADTKQLTSNCLLVFKTLWGLIQQGFNQHISYFFIFWYRVGIYVIASPVVFNDLCQITPSCDIMSCLSLVSAPQQ